MGEGDQLVGQTCSFLPDGLLDAILVYLVGAVEYFRVNG